jgi:hypothetical protein
MAKKKTDLVTVRITGPDCWLDDRHYLPGETAIIPEALAEEWIQDVRAVAVTAEDNKKWQPEEL